MEIIAQKFDFSAPLTGGALARSIGFAWTLRGLGLLNVLYSPLLASLAWKLNSEIQVKFK